MSIRAAWNGLIHGEAKESRVGPAIYRQTAGRAAMRLDDVEKQADEGYAKNVIAYRCICDISEAAANVPVLLFAGEEEAGPDHLAMQRLRRPNPMQGYIAYVRAVLSDYLITGDTFQEAVGPTVGPPIELWSLRPDRMEVIPGVTGIPAAYTYTVGSSQPVRFDVDPLTGLGEVRHTKTFNPLDDWYGLSPIQAAATGINQFNEAGIWNQNLLIRGASRGAVLEAQQDASGNYPLPMGEEQYETMMDRMEDQYGGGRNAGRPKLLEGGMKWKDATFSPQDMDWIDGKHTSARDICNAFNYPTQLLGIPGDNTYSNYKEARQAFYENTVMPLLGLLLDEWNVWFLPRFGEGLTLKADEDQVMGLAPRRESLWDRVNASKDLTIAESRAAKGYGRWEPTGDPQDDLYQPATELPLGFDITDEKSFTAALEKAGADPSTIAELKSLGYGARNGEWRDHA